VLFREAGPGCAVLLIVLTSRAGLAQGFTKQRPSGIDTHPMLSGTARTYTACVHSRQLPAHPYLCTSPDVGNSMHALTACMRDFTLMAHGHCPQSDGPHKSNCLAAEYAPSSATWTCVAIFKRPVRRAKCKPHCMQCRVAVRAKSSAARPYGATPGCSMCKRLAHNLGFMHASNVQ
jgi:hypothetical protein